MPYVPDPANAAQPEDSGVNGKAGTAAAEFRALKGRVNAIKVTADAAAVASAVTAALALKAANGANSDITSLSGLTGVVSLAPFTVATLPVAPADGSLVYATDGRKIAEGAGAGTGVVVYYSGAAWRVFSTDAAVAA